MAELAKKVSSHIGNCRTNQICGRIYLPDGSLHVVNTARDDARPGDAPGISHRREQRTGRVNDPEAMQPGPAVLPGGSRVELITDRCEKKLRFLCWDGKSATVNDQIEFRGKVLTPPAIHHSLIRSVRFPCGIAPYSSACDLRDQIAEWLDEFVDLPGAMCRFIADFALSTWFPDCLPLAAYLSIFGPTESGKTTLQRLISCFCRRALLVGDISPASLYRLPSDLQLTLLIDEADFDSTRRSRELQRLLRAGNTPGELVARNHGLFDPYGPKVITSRLPLQDYALSSRAIQVRMTPTCRNLRHLDTATLEEIAENLQPKLLMFRLQNYDRVRAANSVLRGVEHLKPRARDLARVLAAPLLDDEEMKKELLEIIARQDEDARLERSLEIEWLVVETLFEICHESYVRFGLRAGTADILVGGVAIQVNKKLEFRGEDQRFSARAVGSVLKSLGIRTRKIGNLGRGLRMTLDFRREVHELASQYDFSRRDITSLSGIEAGYGGEPCALCDEFALGGGLKFVDIYPKPIRHKASSSRRSLFEDSSQSRTEFLEPWRKT